MCDVLALAAWDLPAHDGRELIGESMSVNRKAGIILAVIAVSEGCWLFFTAWGNLGRFLVYTGFYPSRATALGWTLGLAAAFLFTFYAARLPSVRANLFRPSVLKLLAVAVAVTAGFCEEVIFRKWLMDALQRGGHGIAIQLAASALSFGAAHAIWGLMRGSLGAALGAMLATGALGLALAIVYVAGSRVVAPCVLAHFLINLAAEPGLVLAALKGEMSGRKLGTLKAAT
jgi:membrane protease YdiL (CAAX protease family)